MKKSLWRFVLLFFAMVFPPIASGLEPDFDLIKESLVQVRTYKGDALIGHGTGFFTSEDGKLATNFHVIQDAIENGLTLKICLKEQSDDLIDVDVWSVWPERDMALLYVKTPKLTKFRIIPLADKAPKAGQLIWALGYPMTSDVKASVTRGSISAIRSAADVESFGKLGRELDGKSSWIQMDTAINPGNSGGPVVNELGQAVGISTMTRRNAQGMNFAIDLFAVRNLIAKPTGTPVGIAGVVVVPSLKVRSPKSSNEKEGSSNSDKVLTIPKFEIKPFSIEQKAKPNLISEAAIQFKNSVKKVCSKCGGNSIIEKVSHQGNVDPSKDRKVVSKTRCTYCEKGYATAKPEVVYRTGVNVLKVLPTILPESSENELSRTKALDQVAGSFVLDMEWSDTFQKMCVRNLQKDKIATDGVVCARGYVLGSTLYGETKRYIIWIYDTDLLFLVDRPVDHDRAADLAEVVFGGMVTSSIDTKSSRVLIVQGGFVRTYSKVLQMLKD